MDLIAPTGVTLSLDDPTTTAPMPNINKHFGDEVSSTLDNWQGKQLSLRQARHLTGIDIETLSRMRKGEVPRIDKIIAFARGFNQDINDWLEIAGYEPIRSTDTAAAARDLLEIVENNPHELEYEPILEDVDVRQFAGARDIPDADVRILNEAMKAAITAARKRSGLA